MKQSFLDEFEKNYALNCNQKETRKKNRNVSYDSPFDPKNVPPQQYMQAEKILDKPGKIDLAKLEPATIPLAVRMGELG